MTAGIARRRLAAAVVLAAGIWGAAAVAQQPAGRSNPKWAAVADAEGAPAEYEFAVLSDVMVPMRDGVKLATDVYIPARDGRALPGPWPVVIERTPYSKTFFYSNAPDGKYYATHGYVMVAQDVRGRYKSEGVFGAYAQEAADGWDAFTWIRTQPWSNGKIAVTGSSYFAVTAQAILVQSPPGLTAAVIRVGSGSYHEDGAWRGGAFLLAHNVNYALSLASSGQEANGSAAITEGLASARRDGGNFRLMQQSPLKPRASPLALAPSYDTWYQDWQNHELYDEYWKANGNGFLEHYAQAPDIPILLIGEWYDAFLGGSLDGFAAFSRGHTSPVHLIVAPHAHENVYSLETAGGDVDMGPASPVHVQTEMMKWFDQYLRGKDQGLKPGKLMRAFRIEGGDGTRTAEGHLRAGGTWQEFSDWPPPDAKPTKYYLAPDRGLSPAMPASGAITFTFDPQRPVPSISGPVSSGNPVQAGPADQRCTTKLVQCKDTLPLNARPDVLSFSTPPLDRDQEVTGSISVQLWISSSAVDTDFTAMLIDQYPPTPAYPEGYAMNVQSGIVRARLRSFKEPGPGFHRAYALRDEPLTPGAVYDVTIDLWGASYLFRKGHDIRLDVSSSSFPQFDVNPNTGEPFAKRRLPAVVARNTIYMGGDRPSSITLPLRGSR